MGGVMRVFRDAAVGGIAVFCFVLLANSANAQNPDQKGPDQSAQQKAADAAAKDQNQKKTDEFVEAAQAINGPAGNPECVWLGRRVVSLMWRDDLDTAFRHLDLYDRFGCPGGHVQATFRCLVRFGGQIDPKVADTLNGRVHACWINPNAQPQGVTVPVLPSPPPAPEKK
ncbi:MAG: beta-1-3, beta-1-6-glucan biosynthesis protein [Afipia sp.]|nr:beta-1-3, beta-1-6-glucan biosynthesis protein [Afipia sp.]